MEKYLLCILSISSASAFINYQHRGTEDLTICVGKFIQGWKLHNNGRSHLLFTVINNEKDLNLVALHKLNDIQFLTRKSTGLTNLHAPPSDAYIVMSENFMELEEALTQVSTDLYWHPTTKFLIIIQNMKDNISEIGRLLLAHNLFDATLITHRNNDYAIYKYNITSKFSNIKRDHQLVLASWCSKLSHSKSFLPPMKNISLRGYRFKFIAPNIWPFINFNDSHVKGTEQHLLSLFEYSSGAKIDLVMQPDYDRYGNLITNHTEHMLRSVHKGDFEGTVGAYNLRSANLFYKYSDNLSYTYPLAVDHLVYVLPRADALSPWQAILGRCLYSCIVSAVLFIIFCTATAFLDIFPSRKKQVSRNIFLILGYVLNKTSVVNINRRLPHRLIVINLLLFAFIMPYALQSYVYSVMTTPVKGYEPTSLDELRENKLILYTEFPEKGSIEYDRDCGLRLDCLLDVKNSEDKSLYTIIEDSFYYMYFPHLVNENCNLGVYNLQSPYAMLLRVIFVRRGSIVLKPLNNLLFNSMSAGLLNKYGGDIYRKYGLRCKRHKQINLIPLKLGDLYGAHVILIVGTCLSFFVLICEFVMKKYETNQ